MKSATKLSIAFGCLACFGMAHTAKAATPAFTFLPANTITENDRSYVLGNQFTTTSTITVAAVGYYDYGSDGLGVSHDIGIYDSLGNLIAGSTATVPSGTAGTLIDGFRYVNLSSSLTLAPGTYTEAATDDQETWAGFDSVTSQIAGVTFDKGLYSVGGATLDDPNGYFGFQAYGGPNFTTTAVPEASAMVSFGLMFGMGGLFLVARKRRANAS